MLVPAPWRRHSCLPRRDSSRRLAVLALLLTVPTFAQQPAPPYAPTAGEIRQITTKADELAASVRALRAARSDDTLLADVEIYEKAARWILKFPEEFYTKDHLAQTLTALDRGIERAQQLRAGKSPWVAETGRRTMRGYRSGIDGSVQPYGLYVPASNEPSRPIRLDVNLHGRQGRQNEVNFLTAWADSKNAQPTDSAQIQLDVFGRMNNAYHWAGEADVFEAIQAVQKRYKIDPARIVLKGFSMGGHGAWFIGLHYPDRWVALEAGAGSTRSRRLDEANLPAHQQAMLRIFDNLFEWSLNLHNLPVAGYGGELDRQLRASVMVREQLVKEGLHIDGEPFALAAKEIPAIFLVGPQTPHRVHPDSRKRMDAFLREQAERGQRSPERIRFVTYTTRYNRSYWVTLDGLEKHYERSEIDARRSDDRRRYDIATKNLARLILREADRAADISIDGQTVRVKSAPEIALEKSGASWRQAGLRNGSALRKKHALQGPIDDAFLDPFLCVRPTGTPWNAAANQQALQRLEHFDRIHAKYFRGHVRVKDDAEVTGADLKNYHVVLFGDPGSNRLIARLHNKLPLQWTRENIAFGNRTFAAADHLPAMIYPNPANPALYVVLNSGLTVEDRDYPMGDYLTPRLGDFAILKVGTTATEPVCAGLFDESWQLGGAGGFACPTH
ncbi:MAG: hypothetical protein ACRD8O_15810 [Bryobacteraceae bacterium]